MSKKKKNIFFIYLIISAIPLAAIAGTSFLVFRAYTHQKSLIIKEIAEIGDFDLSLAEKTSAAELKLPYPVPEPLRTHDEIKKEIAAAADTFSQNNFNSRDFSRKKLEIIKKYTEAKTGETVTVMTKITKGEFSGKFYGFEGVFVKIGDMKFRQDDILEDFRYLFDSVMAERISCEKTMEFEKAYMEAKKNALDNLKATLDSELHTKYGYSKTEYEGWTSGMELFLKRVEMKKVEFAKDKKQKILDIMKRHRLFGLFQIEIENSSLKKNGTEGKADSPEK